MQQIFYVTLDPEKALGIEDLIPSYHILHSENSQLATPISDSGVDIKNFPKPSEAKIFNTAKLLEDQNLQNYIRERAHGQANILVFKPDQQIKKMCENLGFNLINPVTDLPKKLENKVEFSNFLAQNQLFLQPKYQTFEKFSDLKYEDLGKEFGTEFVIQFYFGHSGNSTFFVKNKHLLSELQDKYPLRKGKIVKKIDGPAYTINACITRFGVVIGGISEQITGIPALTPSKGGTVGNDFSQRHLTDLLRSEIISKTMQFGEELLKLGHKGIFGLDFVLDIEAGTFYLIEANVRQTMSCSFVSYLQRDQKQVPIMLWHVLELVNHNYEQPFACLNAEDQEWINNFINDFRHSTDKLAFNIKNNQPIKASQVFFRNIQPNPVKILDQFPAGIFRMRGRTPDESAQIENEAKYIAVYRLREDGFSTMCLIKRGYNILQAKNDEGFFLSCVPENTTVGEIGEIGRIQSMETAFSSMQNDDINGWLMDVIKAVYENIRIIRID
jgi:hypothetical protein